ncbi:hypothetical protein [Sphingobacterium kyonggiense]|uniref:hypothetical protein n=1 Tax=Sphingobacterium kyonggiense TaxID=714075 RepID=UPI0031D0893C
MMLIIIYKELTVLVDGLGETTDKRHQILDKRQQKLMAGDACIAPTNNRENIVFYYPKL